jgi:exodeoxyribonuclease III
MIIVFTDVQDSLQDCLGGFWYTWGMKIYSWNVNGIRAVIKKGELDKFLTQHNPDIVCLQETKATQDQVDYDFGEYKTYWNSADKKGYSGTAILSKVAPLNILKNFPGAINARFNFVDKYGDISREGRVLCAEYTDFYLITVYTPNTKEDLSRLSMREKVWDAAFYDYITELELGTFGPAKPVVFCGDINVAHQEIDLARPKTNIGKHGFTNEERAGFQRIIDYGMIDSFRLFDKSGDNYTWWSNFGGARSRNIGWRIDYFVLSGSISNNLKSAKIHPEQLGSDHCPVSIELH